MVLFCVLSLRSVTFLFHFLSIFIIKRFFFFYSFEFEAVIFKWKIMYDHGIDVIPYIMTYTVCFSIYQTLTIRESVTTESNPFHADELNDGFVHHIHWKPKIIARRHQFICISSNELILMHGRAGSVSLLARWPYVRVKHAQPLVTAPPLAIICQAPGSKWSQWILG